MATVAKKNSRFDMRLTQEQRSEVERAAAIKGKTLTQWALDNLMESARRDIEEESTTRLSLDALRRSLAVSEQIGARALLVDPADDQARGFYEKYGFKPVPGMDRMFIPLNRRPE